MSNTLRLLMPQWQGGNNPPYYFGAKLLAWLAPEAGNVPQAEVPFPPCDGMELPIENGARAQAILLRQLKSAKNLIEAYHPDRLIAFGGDCAMITYGEEIYIYGQSDSAINSKHISGKLSQ